MKYDDWKQATPPEEIKCEICGDWTKHYRIVTPHGQRIGYVLCDGCAREMEEQLKNEEVAAFQQMEND